MRTTLVLTLLASLTSAFALDPIPRRLPPEGNPLPEKQAQALSESLSDLHATAAGLDTHALLPDAEIYLKAVELALDHHEFYDHKKDVTKAEALLAEAKKRLADLHSGKSPWTESTGSVVRGYRSSIDNSSQPYGLNIPEKLDLSEKPVPLYVWLHGRGDKSTDLHFIAERSSKSWQFAGHLDDGIVLHPFGRQCIGYKSAGEIDVLDAVDHVVANYNIDPHRIALMGFSMGGAGAWHLGAHYHDRWALVHAGAGFVDVQRYQNITAEKLPPTTEQFLWGVYDVPKYARNFLNLPVVAYSGENDKQKDAADYMAETLAPHGLDLRHFIGPGMGHKYHPETIKDVAAFIRSALQNPKTQTPDTAHLQTRTLRYNRAAWVEATALFQHWADSRIDATFTAPNRIDITTKNIRSLELHRPANKSTNVFIDGTRIPAAQKYHRISTTGKWHPTTADDAPPRRRKKHALQGPIDDAFLSPFIVVTPTGKSSHPAIDEWVSFELDHLKSRWRALFRGNLPTKTDAEITPADLRSHNIVLFGTPESNHLITRALENSPVEWNTNALALGNKSFPVNSHVPLLILPNPTAPDRYIVLNSGPTFREAHDRTNSLQNPKLGDFAIIDTSSPPSSEAPGRIVTSGLF
ncbi:MAG: prolyl oligopeptidase family serine peptidase, partial [Verrucomicrobiales bacterium]|nr:prolyl oligopeptidase family serine peptidase [Verrucomicrobiales bacterium]